MLLAFLENPQRVLTRDRILELSRARRGDLFDRSVDVLVSRLRRKLDTQEGAEPPASELIKTLRGAGYMFVPRRDPAVSATTWSRIRFTWPRRLGGRAVLVVLATVMALHLGSIVVHHEEAVEAADTVAASQVAGPPCNGCPRDCCDGTLGARPGCAQPVVGQSGAALGGNAGCRRDEPCRVTSNAPQAFTGTCANLGTAGPPPWLRGRCCAGKAAVDPWHACDDGRLIPELQRASGHTGADGKPRRSDLDIADCRGGQCLCRPPDAPTDSSTPGACDCRGPHRAWGPSCR